MNIDSYIIIKFKIKFRANNEIAVQIGIMNTDSFEINLQCATLG